MEVYENHLGGIYFDEKVLDFDDLYCEECGDSDRHLGHADTWDDVIGLLSEDDGEGGTWVPYSDEYLDELKSRFEAATEPLQ